MRKLGYIALNFVPIVVMIALIPIIKNDHLLAVVYLIIVAVSLFIKRDEKDFLVFFLGLVMLTISETIFQQCHCTSLIIWGILEIARGK